MTTRDTGEVPMDKKQFIGGKNILITGGTGTVAFGLIEEVLKYGPRSVRILSNDENGMFEFRFLVAYSNFRGEEVQAVLADGVSADPSASRFLANFLPRIPVNN